jgi:exodeoxyribonuclease X
MTVENVCDPIAEIRPKALIRVIDLETTGLEADDEIIEIGAVDLNIYTGDICDRASQIVRPRKPIPPLACAVHHITDDDVVSAPSWADVGPQVFDGDQNIVAFAAHKASFETGFITADLIGGKSFICTLKAALRLWPEAPGHSNQALRYWLKLPVDRQRAIPAHRALPDAYVTAHILREMLNRASVDQLVLWSQQPALLINVGFGKHKGMKWTDVPDDYLGWIVSKGDFDEDVMHTVQTIRANRQRQSGVCA